MLRKMFKLLHLTRSDSVSSPNPETPVLPANILPAKDKLSEPTEKKLIRSETTPDISGFNIQVTFSGPESPPVPKEMVEREYEQFKFITTREISPLGIDDIWFVRDSPVDSKGLPVWMPPLLPSTDFDDPEIRNHLKCEPNGLIGVAVSVRKRIRAKQKANETYNEELDFLYRLAILDDLVSKCALLGLYDYIAMRSLSRSEMAQIQVDYRTIGFDSLRLLNVTDKKLLTEEYGTPQFHASVADLYPEIIRNALSRHFWSELNNRNSSKKALGIELFTIESLIKHHIEMHLGYQLEYQQRMERKKSKEPKYKVNSSLVQLRKALSGDFVVADLETTGLDRASDAIIEMAAIKIKNRFAECERFSTLVSSDRKLSAYISQLTGITDDLLRTDGVELSKAVNDFHSFVGDLPLFFHNAAFDQAFLQRAFQKAGKTHDMPAFDTLALFRKTWPELPNHKLQSLCEKFSVKRADSHRALSDCDALVELIKLAVEEHKAKRNNKAKSAR
jgi:DNA polymerase III subunit epsilon